MNRYLPRLAMLLLLFVGWSPLAAQESTNQAYQRQLRQGLQYERRGQLSRAAALYHNLHRQYPARPEIVLRLQNVYVQQKRYTDALALLESYAKAHPQNLIVYRQWANILFLMGRPTQARAVCRHLLDQHPQNPGAYQLVASLYQTHGLLDDAETTYLAGRRACRDQALFAQELAHLYSLRMDVTGAVREYLRLLNHQPAQFNFINNRLTTLAADSTARVQIAQSLAEASSDFAGRGDFFRLLGNYYLTIKDPYQALQAYRQAEYLQPSGGRFLVELGAWCEKQALWEPAIQAYRESLLGSPTGGMAEKAQFGLAHCLAAMGQYERAVQTYQTLIDRYPRARQVEQSLFQIAEIQYQYLTRIPQALGAYRRFLDRYPKSRWRIDALFRIGDCYLRQGNLEQAAAQYERLLAETDKRRTRLQQEPAERALFQLGRVAFYRQDFAAALEYFNELAAAYPQGIYANDALEWALFLDQYQSQEAALKRYAEAQWLTERHDLQQALQVYRELLNSYPQSTLGDETVLAIADLLGQLGEYFQAIAAYQELIGAYRESPYRDTAQKRIAEIYDFRLNDQERALDAYETLLNTYPNSLLVAEVRRRILALRQERALTP